jgi:hypothetical protein
MLRRLPGFFTIPSTVGGFSATGLFFGVYDVDTEMSEKFNNSFSGFREKCVDKTSRKKLNSPFITSVRGTDPNLRNPNERESTTL